MEEEREEEMPDRNVVHQSNRNNRVEAPHAERRGESRGRSLSRKRNSAVDVLEAVSAAASQSERSRGKSLPRNKGNAAAAAIAAALSEKNKTNHHRQQQVNPKAKSRSFHDTRQSSLKHHCRTHGNRPSSQFRRKSSRSVSPLRSAPTVARSKSFHPASHPADASVVSHNSSASSTFSAYDRRVAKDFETAVSSAASRRGSIKHTSSSDMALCDKGKGSGNALLDEDGCCALHPFIQLKMKLPNGKWRTLTQNCVVCQEEEKVGSATSKMMAPTSSSYHHRRSSESGASKSKVERQQRQARASVAVMELCESGECSLTPSFLEEDDDDGPAPCRKKPCDDSSSSGSTNSLVEHKIKTSVACSSRASRSDHKSSPRAELPPFEVSFPNKISSFDEESLKSKQSLDLSHDDANCVKSNLDSRRNQRVHDQDDTRSVRSSAAARRHHATEQDDNKSIKSSATARRKRTSTKSAIDMSLVDSVVESAMQKIKSMEEMPSTEATQVKSSTEASPSITRSNPPPPPPPRNQTNKNLSSRAHPKHASPNHNGSHNGSSNNSSLQRPPPPPPPPRKITPAPTTAPPDDTVDYGCSMNVLNPDPEPELQNEYGNDFDEMIPPFEQMEVSRMGAAVDPQQNATPGLVNAPAKDWMAYCITSSGREGKDQKGGKRRIFGRNSAKNAINEREIIRSVRQMPFTDQFGDYGLYTGQVNEDGRPDGKGSMKYDNGVFYEGTWTNGGQDQKAAMQYERIRGGFTSWQGRGSAQTKSGSVLPWNARKNDAVDPNKKIHVRGMEWTDVNGDSGRYTGEVNTSELPHGHGIMKYDFGLIAEGEWSNGVLKENPQDRMMAAVAAAPMSSGRSVGPGMSVGPGAQGFNAAASVMGSVIGSACVMGGVMPVGPAAAYPMPYGGMNPMMMGAAPANFTMMAQQNAMLKSQATGMYGGGSVFGGGSVYGGGSAYGSAHGQMPPVQMQGTQGQNEQLAGNGPPTEIKIN